MSYHGQLDLEGDHIVHVLCRLGVVSTEENGDVGEDVLEDVTVILYVFRCLLPHLISSHDGMVNPLVVVLRARQD